MINIRIVLLILLISVVSCKNDTKKNVGFDSDLTKDSLVVNSENKLKNLADTLKSDFEKVGESVGVTLDDIEDKEQQDALKNSESVNNMNQNR